MKHPAFVAVICLTKTHLALTGMSVSLCGQRVNSRTRQSFNPKDDCQQCREGQEQLAEVCE